MEIINTEGISSLILGDVNICLLKYGTNDKTRDYVDGILSRGFFATYSQAKQSDPHFGYSD